MKILIYIFIASWALLSFYFIVNDGVYVVGGLTIIFLLICIGMFPGFKKMDTSTISSGRKWWANTVSMIGFGLQVIGVGVMGSELVETQPQLTYIFGSVFCIVGFTLFYKAHLMFKQGAENIVKIEKIDVAEAYREASRDLEFSNTNTNVNEFQKPKKIRAIEIKKLDFETIANYDELEDIAHAIIYYINEDGHKVDVTMSIYLLEPSEDLSLIGDCSKYTISGQDEINKTNVEITMRSIYRVIDYKTKKPVKRSNTFDFIEEVVARSDLEFRRLKKLNRSSLSIT